MMRTFLITIISAFFLGCGVENEISLILKNPVDMERMDEIVEIQRAKLILQDSEHMVILDGDKEIPFDLMDKTLVINVDFEPNESKVLKIISGKTSSSTFPKRAHAEISVRTEGRFENGKYVDGSTFKNLEKIRIPAWHVAHDDYIRYEGPGWESDRVGYRLYLDNRNTIDIFGKKTNEMILQHVGRDTSTSYHEMHWWGMDVFKVGNSLGMGAIGAYVDDKAVRIQKTDSMVCKIDSDNTLQAEVSLAFHGWAFADKKIDLISDMSIQAGSRLTKNLISYEPKDEEVQLCTGLIKCEDCILLKSENDGPWKYVGLYGPQSLAGDQLGTVIFYNSEQTAKVTEDELNELIVFKKGLHSFHYYFGAAWEQEKQGLKSEQEFISYCEEQVKRLNNPIEIEF